MNLFLLLLLFVVTLFMLLRIPKRVSDVLAAMMTILSIVGIILVHVLWPAASMNRPQGALTTLAALLGAVLSILIFGNAIPQHKTLKRRRTKTEPASRSANPTIQDATTADIKLEDYEVLDRVGVGGMGGVFRARRKSDNQTVALKIPHERYLADAKFMKRFYREAELLKRFRHPNIVTVYDYRMRDPEHYIAMEFLDGESLEHYLEERPLSIAQNVQILRVLADALKHIHSHNIVHRDIKPANIMLIRGAFTDGGRLREGGIKLMDFGIAVGTVLTRLTSMGARVGTPVYMAPEQAKGNRVDHRSDVYSLGLVAYEMLSGQTAFKGSYEAVVHQQIFEVPKSPKEIKMEIPSKLNDLVMHMIAKDPSERPSLDEVIRRIDEGVLVDDPFTDPVALAVCIQERQGMVRLLDTQGKLRLSVRDLGRHEKGLPSLPSAMTSDAAGNLYLSVLDSRSEQTEGLIRKIDLSAKQVLDFGEYGLDEGELLQPISLAVYGDLLYVLDEETQMISVFNVHGQYIKRFGGRGPGSGTFQRATTIVTGISGEIYVLDMGNREVQRFNKDGIFVSRYAFRAGPEGDTLRQLEGVTIDQQGKVYIVDGMGKKMRTISADGQTCTSFTFEGQVGEQADAPWLLQVANDGRIFAIRRGGQTLKIYSAVGDLLHSQDMYAPVQAINLLRRRL